MSAIFLFFLPLEGDGWKVCRGGSSFKFPSFDASRERERGNPGSLSSVMEGREGEEEGKYGGREKGRGEDGRRERGDRGRGGRGREWSKERRKEGKKEEEEEGGTKGRKE